MLAHFNPFKGISIQFGVEEIIDGAILLEAIAESFRNQEGLEHITQTLDGLIEFIYHVETLDVN